MAQEEEQLSESFPVLRDAYAVATRKYLPAESSVQLVDLPTDVLSKLYEHVVLPPVLKLVCARCAAQRDHDAAPGPGVSCDLFRRRTAWGARLCGTPR